MRTLFTLFISVWTILGHAIEIDTACQAALIREGRTELCNLLEHNTHAESTSDYRFVVVLDGDPNGINYTAEKNVDGNTEDILTQATVDAINDTLAAAFTKYGVEMYVIMMKSFNFVVKTDLPVFPSGADLFTKRLYDEESNINLLRAAHQQITYEIIYSTFSVRARDCLVYSRADYKGAYAPGKTGIWTLSKRIPYYAANPTYEKLDELTDYYYDRITNNPSVIQGGYENALQAAAAEFYESAKYMHLKSAILTTYDNDSLNDIFQLFNETIDYQNLTEEERIHALAVYAGYPMHDNLNSSEERIACRIIEGTPTEQASDFLAHLAENSPLNTNALYHGDKPNEALIVSLIDEVDDVGPGGNNYARMMHALTNVALSDADYVNAHLPTTDQEWLDRQFYWDDWHALNCPPVGTHDYDVTLNANGTVRVVKKVVDSIFTTNYVQTPRWDQSYPVTTVNPFDLVIVTNRSSLGMLQVAGAAPNQPYLAPAILIKYCDDKAFNTNAIQVTAVALSAVAVLTGPGAIVAAVEVGNFALATFEGLQLLGAVTDIAANSSNDPQFQEAVNNFNLVVGIWGIARLGVTGAKYTVDFIAGVRTEIIKPVPLFNAQEYCAKYDAVTNWSGVDEATKARMAKLREILGKQAASGSILSSTQFSRATINALVGFENEVTGLAAAHNLSLEEFIVLEGKSAMEMTQAEKSTINAIRNSVLMPNGTTIMQKVVPKSDIGKYFDGTYTSVGGFVSTAHDAKHLTSFEDLYYGLRLDYQGTNFHLSDGSCGVIRYRSTRITEAHIPRSSVNDGIDDGLMPYTGHGFTSGNNGRVGVPELKSPYLTPEEGSELWEVFSNGTEVLRGKFSVNQNKFIPVQ